MKKRQKTNILRCVIIIGIALGVLVTLIFVMPIFYIHDIEVISSSYYSADEIINQSQIKGKNVLDLSWLNAKKRITDLPYVQSAKIEYSFPNKVKITIEEKTPFAYVEFQGTYLCINEQGQVIEQSQQKHHKIPVIRGLKFDSFHSGEVLPISNQDNYLTAVTVIQKLQLYEYTEEINEIDVHDIEQIHLYVDKLDVIMGDIGDFDIKIATLKGIRNEGYSVGQLTINKRGEAYAATLGPR